MLEAKRILAERADEINLYFSFISSDLNENTTNATLVKILKANILLMLYNLVEAVVSNSVDAIRTNIYNEVNTNFDCLKNQIKIQIIKDLKGNIGAENFVNQCNNISNDIIKLSFRKESISKGNIDRAVISKIAAVYGFDVSNSNYQETAHGESLSIIKDKRNDLAHGTFSFTEIGRIYSIPDLENLKNQTITYLTFVVEKIETYLNSKQYLN